MAMRYLLLFLMMVQTQAGRGWANSCANIATMGTYDESGLHESNYGIRAVGTFRILEEQDESKQPMFNLAEVNCERQLDDMGKPTGLECKVIKTSIWADSSKPNTESPNCLLDLDVSTYSMKELDRGILAGIETGTGCFNTMLTIDRNTKRVYISFTKTEYADKYDKTLPNICAAARTQVLMNCTPYARMRANKGGATAPSRTCDFNGVNDK